MRTPLAVVLALGLLAAPLVARGQGPGEASTAHAAGETSGTRTFGTASLVAQLIPAWAFDTPGDLTPFTRRNGARRYCVGVGTCDFYAPLVLPGGAVVVIFQLEACDASPTATIVASLRDENLSGQSVEHALVETGVSEQSGCIGKSVVLNTPYTINNVSTVSYVAVTIRDDTQPVDATTAFRAVRVFYKLQVSPAPATATFDDVPTTHVFFPFIEALAAAGITGGCSVSPPLYCPDNFVTRGQMATFISRALGLHFSP